MEDQQSETSDLTAESAASPTPQGKSARSKHRLPRAALRQTTNTDEAADAAPSESTEATTAHVEPDEGTAAEVETADVQTVDDGTTADVTAPEATAPEASAPEATATEEKAPEATVTEVAPTPRIRFGRGRRKATEESAAEESAAATTADTADDDSATDGAAADGAAADDEAVDEQGQTPDVDAPALVLVPHRTAGRSLKMALIGAAALFVAAAAFTGATLQPYLADRAIAHTKFEVAETAAKAITTLWTYTPEDMANLPTRSAKYLGGDFADEYSKYIGAIAAPNKQAQITNNTQVLGAAIESLKGDEATAIVYTNSVATSPVTKGAPSLRYLSYRLAMKRQGADWLITRMTALTSLDVTPRI